MDLDISNRRRAFPNLALMKLSAYHKAKGDEVFLNFPLCRPDITYASCVFTWNSSKSNQVPFTAVTGGPGLDLHATLASPMEHIMPDYTLYPNANFSLGFTSRGCIRKCPWCIVPQKEGKIQPWSSIYEFWDRRHRKIVLLDNNLLAAPNWRSTMDDLLAEDLEVDFNQGLDIRLVKEDNLGYLKRLKTRQLRFAFDDIGYESSVRKGIELLIKGGIPSRKLSFYVLAGFKVDAEDAVERMKILHSYNVDVYPMIYKGPDGREPARKVVQFDDVFWHGTRRNINKFLRLVGRLPE